MRSIGEPESLRFRVAVASRLRAERDRAGLSRQAVEALTDGEIRRGALGNYERAERTISLARLQLLAKIYDVSVDQLLPPEDIDRLGWKTEDTGLGPGLSHPAGVASPKKVTIDLTRLRDEVGPECDVLRRFLSTILLQRQPLITIRAGDLGVIAGLFGITPEEMSQRLHDLGLLVESRTDSLVQPTDRVDRRRTSPYGDRAVSPVPWPVCGPGD